MPMLFISPEALSVYLGSKKSTPFCLAMALSNTEELLLPTNTRVSFLLSRTLSAKEMVSSLTP